MSARGVWLRPSATMTPVDRARAYTQRQMLRDFIIVVSLVNLSYLRIWSELLTARPSDYFYLKQSFGRADYWAAMLGIVGLGVLLWGLTAVARVYARGVAYRACQFVFLVGAVVGPGLAIRSVVMQAANPDLVFGAHQRWLLWLGRISHLIDHVVESRGSRAIAAAAGLAVLAATIAFLAPLVRAGATLLLCASPFVIVTFAQALYAAASRETAVVAEPPTAAYLPAGSGARVVWVLFDEWDYRLSFPERDRSLRLDAVDRLANEALFTTHALPPAGDTFLSVPSYTDGRRVTKSVPERAAVLRITYLDTGETETWGSQPNLFSKARALGINVAVLGCHLPYCRIFNPSLVNCSWFARAVQANTSGDTLAEKLRNQPRSLLETTLFSPFGQSLSFQQHARDYIRMEQALKGLVTGNRFGLVYAHMPAPHFPFVYDRATGTLTRKNNRVNGYIDELALVNRTVAGLRKTLEDSGRWDDTIVLLTSDHPYRGSEALDGKTDPRVPFLLKMKGQHRGIHLDAPFNTVTAGELVLEMLRGDVSTPEQPAGWLLAQIRSSTVSASR